MQYDVSSETNSLYIHWPFCPYRCFYCPFVALASHDQFMEQYHKALVREIVQYGQLCPVKRPLRTIYFGGGTPSTYPDNLLLDTFGILKDIFIFEQVTEITLEVNPGTVRSGQLPFWKSLGINRMSIGVQSLNNTVLKNLNRHQKAQDVYALLAVAPHSIENISVDIILGLPGVSVQEWKELVAEVVTWPIKHISMYVLEVHDTTPLYFKVQSKKITLPHDDDVVDLYYWSREFLANHGFEQYEVSSFAKEGYQSKHNTVYWERKPYRGFGLGACSFDGTMRFQNEKNLMKYMSDIEGGQYRAASAEYLTKEQEYSEKIMLGLRRSQGVVWVDVIADLTPAQQVKVADEIKNLKQNEYIVEENGRLQLTPKGLIVENEIITRLSL